MKDSPNWCPTLRPTEADFRRPFTEYVSGVFRQDPGLPMFKVVPPPAWRPRRGGLPDLKSVCIDSPIRQHAFGQKGAYRCMFVEHKPLQVSEFREIALSEADRLTGHKGQSGSAAASGVVNHTQRHLESRRALHDEEDLMERSFWSSVTLYPPLYGSDTHHSLFDERLSYGWNLRNLGDLLKTKPEMPEIPGVTTPMTYFGMWRSFFGWHKEDVDLYSVNYHHFGAPKVWYCISPNDQAKFERLASSLFPDEAQECSNFLRHKDILISPGLLRSNNVGFVQAKQQPGEFIVLNAGAYHGGYNLGFNCAEAVNFATEDWIDIGKCATRCLCKKDNVRISMSLFDPSWNSDVGEGEDKSEETNFGSETEAEGFSPQQGLTDPSLLMAAMKKPARGGVARKPRRSGTRRPAQQAKKQRLCADTGPSVLGPESLSSPQIKSTHSEEADEDLILAVGRRLLGMSAPSSTGAARTVGSGSSSEAWTPTTFFQQQGLGLSMSPSIPQKAPMRHPSPVFGGVIEAEEDEDEEQQEEEHPSSTMAGGYEHSVFQLPPALREYTRPASYDGISEPSSHEGPSAEEGGQDHDQLGSQGGAEDAAAFSGMPGLPPFAYCGQPMMAQGMQAQGMLYPPFSRAPSLQGYQQGSYFGGFSHPYKIQLAQGDSGQQDILSKCQQAIVSLCHNPEQHQGLGTPNGAQDIDEQYQGRGAFKEDMSEEDNEENGVSPADFRNLPSKAQLQSVYHLPVMDAARALGVPFVVMKRSCRVYDIGRWPYRKLNSIDKVVESMRETPSGDAAGDEELIRKMLLLKAEVYQNPRVEFDSKVKKMRQANFKRQFKLRARALSNKPFGKEALEGRRQGKGKSKSAR